jgi:pantothenate kinase
MINSYVQPANPIRSQFLFAVCDNQLTKLRDFSNEDIKTLLLLLRRISNTIFKIAYNVQRRFNEQQKGFNFFFVFIILLELRRDIYCLVCPCEPCANEHYHKIYARSLKFLLFQHEFSGCKCNIKIYIKNSNHLC